MNSNNSTYESIKDRTTSLVKIEIVNEKELEDCAQELMLIPNLDDDIISASELILFGLRQKIMPTFFIKHY